VFNVFGERIRQVAEPLAAGAGPAAVAALGAVVVEPPRDPAHGDLSSNAAMVLAKPMARNPRELATIIAAALARDPDVDSAEVAGPGFINLRLRPAYWLKVLRSAIEAGESYGRSTVGAGEPINVEYVSANPTGPMHVGHCRGAVVGDALASVLDTAGFAVTREYYINDAGAQVDQLARSAFLRYREALGETIGPIPEGLYPGDYVKDIGRALAGRFGATLTEQAENVWLPLIRPIAIDMMMASIRGDLALLNVRHDVFFSERSLVHGGVDRVADAIAWLSAKGLIYEGRLPPPKGQLPDDWEDREQTLFRSTQFGDDIDRPLKKSDGSYTYFASDIAYHFDKYQRGFRHMIDVLGADHGGYVKRVQAAVKAITGGEGGLDVRLCQLVRLLRAGEPVKMSKRAGEFVTLHEVVEEVGRDPIRFMMVYRKNDATLDFDFQKVTEQSKDNPVFYVQYAHARAASIFRQAETEVPAINRSAASLLQAPLEALRDAGELAMIRRVAEYPRVIESAALHREPHRVAFYLHDLASEFHSHWNRGKELPQLRFIMPSEPERTAARLALVHGVKLVLSAGLGILGVSAPDEMR
jgi:arginyl-tRNA synthetase